MRERFDYCSHYCEENVWRLCQREELADREVEIAFVSNAEKTCLFWNQRAAHSGDSGVVWDYHVILLAASEAGWEVWDLDTTLPFPCAAATYLEWTFQPELVIPDQYRPRFRLLTRAEFLRWFSSDRSHMVREGGGWNMPPPAWEAPFQETRGMNLARFFSMEEEFVGEVLSLEELCARKGVA